MQFFPGYDQATGGGNGKIFTYAKIPDKIMKTVNDYV